MRRRDAVKLALLGTAAVACGRDASSRAAVGGDDWALLEEIADTLLPTTAASPGARAAGAGAGIRLLLADCYDAAARRRVADGLRDFRRRAPSFASLPRPERERVLREVDAEARRAGDAHWFHLAREVSLRAYLSSEVGTTRALRWVQTPGRWVGCVPLEPGQPAWA
jgi:hypothetical protein